MENRRWIQRFQNYRKALQHLDEALQIINPDIIQQAGLIQFFEMSTELVWNTMKDYLEEQGFQDIRSPRAAIKTAFKTELIKEGQTWLQLLEDRNLTAHAYDEESVNYIETLIRNRYFPLFQQLLNTLKNKQNE